MIRKALSVLLLAVAFLAGGMLGPLAVQAVTAPENVNNPIAMRGCVIRFDTLSPTGKSVVPRIYENTAHACVGVTSVSVDWSNGDLVVRGNGSNTVVSVVVSPDETLTAKGISAGASGGGNCTRVRFYDRDGHRVPAYSLDLYSPAANLWMMWAMWEQ